MLRVAAEDTPKLRINLITAPGFVATKLEAFYGQAQDDFVANHDIEDLIAIIRRATRAPR